MTNFPVDRFVSSALGASASLGLLSTARWLSANSGSAATTNALKTLGFGKGMNAGIAVLVFLAVGISQTVQAGFPALASVLIQTRLKNGDKPDEIMRNIERLPVSEDIKRVMREQVHSAGAIAQD